MNMLKAEFTMMQIQLIRLTEGALTLKGLSYLYNVS